MTPEENVPNTDAEEHVREQVNEELDASLDMPIAKAEEIRTYIVTANEVGMTFSIFQRSDQIDEHCLYEKIAGQMTKSVAVRISDILERQDSEERDQALVEAVKRAKTHSTPRR